MLESKWELGFSFTYNRNNNEDSPTQQNNHHDKDYSSNARSGPESETIIKEKKESKQNKRRQTEYGWQISMVNLRDGAWVLIFEAVSKQFQKHLKRKSPHACHNDDNITSESKLHK